jgi:hypothetical protein
MKLYKHVTNARNEIVTVEFEVTESPKTYTVIDKNIMNTVWEKKIKKDEIGIIRGSTVYSYNMITKTSNPAPFIRALITKEESYEKHLKKELEQSVHRKTQLMKFLDEKSSYDGMIINCPECGKEIEIEFNTARCEKCDWFAADAELDEIMKEE